MITADVLEIGGNHPNQTIIATVSSGTILVASDSSIDNPNSLSVTTSSAYDLA